MKNIFQFLKKYWLLIMLGFTAILYVVNLLLPKNNFPTNSISTEKIASYKNITPGVSNENDLKNVLGTPTKTIFSGEITIDEYDVTNSLRNHIALIKASKLVFFKEIITAEDNIKSSDITNIYGVAPHILYEKYPSSVFNLYVYPSNGIAYLGHQDGGLLEILYFQPTTIEGFTTSWGKDYLKYPATETGQ